MDISKWALHNKKLIYFLVAVLAIGGCWSIYDISKLEDPELRPVMASVATVYPGASAHQIEMEVTDPLEKAIRTMGNIETLESSSLNNLSIIYITLKTNTPQSKVDAEWTRLREKVEDASGKLPSGCNAPQVISSFSDVYGLFYAVTNDGYNETEFNNYLALAQREVENIDGVKFVTLYGQRQETIDICIDEARMSNLGVLPAEVLATIDGQHKTVYAGNYESNDQRLRVNIDNRYTTAEDIRNLIICGHEEDNMRLDDVSDIVEGYASPRRNGMTFDGVDAVGFSIAVDTKADITKIGKKVEKRLASLEGDRIPAGIKFNKVFFQSDRVNESLGKFARNLIESIIIVVGVLMLTMGFRSGSILGFCLLITVLGSFLMLNFTGGAAQRVSIGSFILAMGMLVDNAIVIIDGILVDLRKGKPREEALTSIGRKTAMPLLGATVVAIVAFLPVYLSPDMAGTYLKDLFIVLAVSLLLSWLLALTFVPIVADKMLKVKPEDVGKDQYGNKFYRMFSRLISWTLRYRWLTVLMACVLLCGSLYGYRYLRQGFFPDMSYNQLYVEYTLPEGTSSVRTERDLKELSNYLLQQPDIVHVTTSLGGTPSRYNLVRSIAEPSMSYGELIVDYTSQKKLVSNIDELQNYLNENYPRAYARVKRYNLMYKKFQIEARFSGPDPAILRNLTAQAEKIMRKNNKVKMVTNNWQQPSPMINVAYSQPVARELGLSRSDVGLSVLAATDGIPIGTLYDGTHTKQINVRCVNSEGGDIAALDNIPVFGTLPSLNGINEDAVKGYMAGIVKKSDIVESLTRTVPLSEVADSITLSWEEPVVRRYNGQRSICAQCDVAAGESVETARRSLIHDIESIQLPDGYSFEWGGEHYASTQSTRFLFATYPFAIILMITILIMLFGDYKKPLVIICSIPFLLVGVVTAFLVTDKTFGFVALIGTLGLVGMMIKNGVVLMDEIKLQLASGMEPVKAITGAATNRFRPVMMASITTILGVIPLYSDDLFGPMAVAIMGGLLIGTLVTLLLIPTIYALFFRIRNKNEKVSDEK